MRRPDYPNSLLALASSVLKHYGVNTPHKSLACMDELLSSNPKNVVVMLFDGMGTHSLEKHLDESAFLRRHFVKTISSVFPPTTTAATTTIESGLSPIEHGWLGWCLHFDEVGGGVCLFPNTIWRKDEQAAPYHLARTHIPYKPIFDKIIEGTNGKIEAFNVSKYSSFACENLDDICDTVRTLCARDGRRYIYTYYNQPDFDMHDFGIGHERVKAHIQEINDKVESLAKEVKDTLIIVTADHGLIDTKWEFIPEYDEIKCCLSELPTIEARAMTFFIKEGMNEQFERAFNKHFGKYYELYTHQEVFDNHIFGEGIPNERAHSFIGDYLAVATSDVSLEVEGRSDDLFKGVHAGATEQEYNIPFIVIKR